MKKDDSRPFALVAADIGGTHVRIGWLDEPVAYSRAIDLRGYRTYRGAEYADPAAIFADFLAGRTVTASDCVIAIAGAVQPDGSVVSNNLPWTFSARTLGEQFGFRSVHLLNDFEALAYAVTQMDDSEWSSIHGPANASGPILLIGPGTGLGVAVSIPAKPRPLVLASEAGQMALAPSTEKEMEVLQRMLRRQSHIPAEQVVSGPGILNLYQHLCALRDTPAIWTTPEEISAAALAGKDALAEETLEMFCGWLGSVAGDLALVYNITGGVYLAGGILPEIHGALIRSRFVSRFLDKGHMRATLEKIPIKLIEHGRLGVVGAVCWYAMRT
jgi:glucokinase